MNQQLAAARNATGIVLIASNREDRRTLFDVLDGNGFSNLYLARNTAQARTLLAGRPAIALVLIDFPGAAPEAVAFCRELHETDAYHDVRVIGLASPGRQHWSRDRMPPDVLAWLATPVVADEALAAVNAQLAPAPDAAVASGEPAASRDADYRFAFDQDDHEWIISSAEGTVLEVNPAFARNAGVVADSQPGRMLADLLGEGDDAPATLRDALASQGSLERLVHRQRSDGGSDLMRATTRTALRGGQRVDVTSLQHYGHTAHARAMLNLLTQLHAAGHANGGLRKGAHLLLTALPLNFVGLYAAFPEQRSGPTTLAQELREPLAVDEAMPELVSQPMLRRVLDGETVVWSDDAKRLAGGDPFIAAMGFAAFAGLPLVDERGTVLGALLAGSREVWNSADLVAETMAAAGVHFSSRLELQRARKQGRARGLIDGLTRLPNRLLFNDRLETTLRGAHRTGELFAVLFVDLDRFKSINDALGHSVGDEVLAAVARRLRGSVRSSDTVARYAGDEFTLILRHITQREDVLRIAEKIVRLMDAPLMLADGSELHITASLGVSFYPDDATTSENLLKHADVAMYNAKGKGRNGYQVYEATPETSHQQRMALESQLRQAQSNGELRVYYQPQVDARTEDIVGMEALVRWEHPELGMISPGFFIPLAEETGLIVGIGEWVLRTACEATARWHKRYGVPLRIGVNLSALQLMQADLVERVRSALADSGLPAASLELEITESISVKSVPHLADNLNALRDLGCCLAVDDFGTGQSSLDYLKNIPADRIKIDQSFVRNIEIDPDDEAIVTATIDMVHSLKRSAVAEGVETEGHLEFLRKQKCDVLQGYLFCRPLARNAFDTLLAERQRLLQRSDIAS